MSDAHTFGSMCPHCGTTATRRIGECNVCRRVACEHCGNVHYRGGDRVITHRECLAKESLGFKMIKFVK